MLLFGLISGQLTPFSFIAILVGIFVGITIHEFAHAYIAYRCGDPTAKYEGRLTLNPFAHLDPVGTLLILVAGFGWGKPVPINPHYFRGRNDEIKVALAGIVTNILFALIIALPIRFAILNGQLIDNSQFLLFLDTVVQINLLLAAFNIIPIPPLDGSHIVEHFLGYEARETYETVGPTILIGLIIIGVVTNISIFQIIVEPLVRFLSTIVEGTAGFHF